MPIDGPASDERIEFPMTARATFPQRPSLRKRKLARSYAMDFSPAYGSLPGVGFLLTGGSHVNFSDLGTIEKA